MLKSSSLKYNFNWVIITERIKALIYIFFYYCWTLYNLYIRNRSVNLEKKKIKNAPLAHPKPLNLKKKLNKNHTYSLSFKLQIYSNLRLCIFLFFFHWRLYFSSLCVQWRVWPNEMKRLNFFFFFSFKDSFLFLGLTTFIYDECLISIFLFLWSFFTFFLFIYPTETVSDFN